MPRDRSRQEKSQCGPARNSAALQPELVDCISPPQPLWTGLRQCTPIGFATQYFSFGLAQRHPPASPIELKASLATFLRKIFSGPGFCTPNLTSNPLLKHLKHVSTYKVAQQAQTVAERKWRTDLDTRFRLDSP